MKERAKRFLTSIVAALTLVSSVPAQAYASELDTESSLISPQDNGTTPDVGSGTAPAGESNTADGNTATNDSTVDDTTTNVNTTNETPTDVTPTTDTTNGNSTPIDENDLGEDDLGEADQDDWDVESEDTLILSVEASAFSLRAAATQETNLLAEEDSSTEENQTATPVVTIGNTQLGSSAENGGWDAGWNTGSETEKASGWRYDGTSVSMVNNGTAVNVHAEGTGVDFSMAGVNHIGTLYADGDVNITGTGILLIDEIDMLENTKLNLLTNTSRYTDGSVAVFLLNKTSGEYELINGKGETNVAGILDEEYTIPAGITLVVPSGGTLDMRVTTEVTTTTVTQTEGTKDGQAVNSTVTNTETHYGFTAEDAKNAAAFKQEQQSASLITDESSGTNYTVTETVNKEASFFTPVLNIAETAILKIQAGAQLLMQSFINSIFKDPQVSELNVSGTLELGGTIKSYANENDGTKKNFILNVLSGGRVSGGGTMTDVVATYEEGAGNGDTLNLAGNSHVAVKSSGIDSLTSSGTASVIFDDNVSIGSVTNSGTGLTFYGIDATDRLNITRDVKGSYTVDSGYVTIGGNFANQIFDSFDVYEGNIPTFVPNSEMGIMGSIPSNSGKPLPTFTGYVVGSNNSKMTSMVSKGFYKGDINYEAMKTGIGNYPIFEVYTYDATTKKVTLHLISSENPGPVDKSKVFQICGIKFSLYPNSESGSGISSTNTSNTGSGILGGQNAGSLAGGNPNSVLGGNRQPPKPTEPTTPPAETKPANPEPTQPVTPPAETKPADPEPTEPKPTEPKPTEPKPTEPKPTEPKPTEPKPTEPKPTEPKPTEPKPTEPKPTEAGYSGDISTGNNVNSSDMTVKILQDSTDFRVTAYVDGVELKTLEGGTIPVTMEVTLQDGWNKNDLFVVFRGENGSLIAVKARYNPVTGMLMFDAPMLGKFQLVSFPWDGTDYESEAFLSALDDYLN